MSFVKYEDELRDSMFGVPGTEEPHPGVKGSKKPWSSRESAVEVFDGMSPTTCASCAAESEFDLAMLTALGMLVINASK